jgi:hypothetical protein
MTRYAVDASVALALVENSVPVADGDQLVGPGVLRSDVLALLYASVRAGGRTEREGRDLLEGLAALRIRLLGDRVSRALAWRIALEQGWDDPRAAEYVAVARLQADVLVTDDPALAAAAGPAVRVAGARTLVTGARPASAVQP